MDSLDRGEIDFRAGDIIDQVCEEVLGDDRHDLDDLRFAEPGVADRYEVIGGNLAPGFGYLAGECRSGCGVGIIRRTLACKLYFLPATVEELAEVAALSPRQFARAFRAETGQTPAKAVEQMRLEAARLMIEETRHPMDQIAREAGFVDIRRMREAFTRQYGQPPQTLRRLAKAL